ncbi:MAG TPA: hypothetical protein VE988_15795 [Gemmataceae bacterium]|nr:hypothetical protein [Gemmataceae bacterium]
MSPRRWLIVVLAGSIFASMGAQYRTQNFEVHAQNQEVAQQVGQWAEYYRKAKAIEWLGQEMPNWPRPCPLYVTVNMEGPSGATSFNFHPQGGVMDMKMEIQGPLDRLLASVLPHEITHTVFAHHFRRAVPRWADEGGSVLSEDDIERERHNTLVRSILNRTQQFRLRQLFSLKDYPGGNDKVMCLYAQGFSVSHYLVYISDRQTFLKFVGIGMAGNWDQAAQTCYGMNSVEKLEEAWLKHLRDTKGITIAQLAKNKEQGQLASNAGKDNSGTLVRLTAPPVQPLQPVPVVRGAMPGSTQPGQTFGSPQQQAKTGYLPDAIPGKSQPGQSWQMPAQQPTGVQRFEQQYAPIGVQLGAPQNQQPTQYIPPASSPVGFPRQ